MTILINQELVNILPGFKVIAYTMEVDNDQTDRFEEYFKTVLSKYADKDNVSKVLTMKRILDGRNAYKKLGKDPSHTRLACEALQRRAIKEGTLYRLGDIIDIGNLLSIETQCSVCVVDADKIEGNVTIRIGLASDEYYGINRGKINISNIPVYCDNIGPFGNPTSDTDRTKVTIDTKKILIMLICFDALNDDYTKDEQLIIDLYKTYTNARKITKIEVDKYDG